MFFTLLVSLDLYGFTTGVWCIFFIVNTKDCLWSDMSLVWLIDPSCRRQRFHSSLPSSSWCCSCYGVFPVLVFVQQLVQSNLYVGSLHWNLVKWHHWWGKDITDYRGTNIPEPILSDSRLFAGDYLSMLGIKLDFASWSLVRGCNGDRKLPHLRSWWVVSDLGVPIHLRWRVKKLCAKIWNDWS